MGEIFFSSCKPYLQICLSREAGITVTFSKEAIYTPKNEVELKLLREYAEATKSSCIIEEGADPADLMRRAEELEHKLIEEAKARRKAEQEAEEKRKQDHEYYSLLRMSDRAYR